MPVEINYRSIICHISPEKVELARSLMRGSDFADFASETNSGPILTGGRVSNHVSLVLLAYREIHIHLVRLKITKYDETHISGRIVSGFAVAGSGTIHPDPTHVISD
jgi:hypothetical protein